MPNLSYTEPAHPLINMRDAGTALQILSRSGDLSTASLCVCCENAGKSTCPHQGKIKTGHCATYKLDESDVSETERRVNAAICCV
jgi:hypothetical protein